MTIRGELKIIQIDDDAGVQAQPLYFLRDKESGKTFRLRFADHKPRHLRSGMVITAQGKAKGQELLLAADGGGQQSRTLSSSPSAVVAGDQKTLVIVANLVDAAVTCSTDAIRDLMFNGTSSSVDGLYKETSCCLV